MSEDINAFFENCFEELNNYTPSEEDEWDEETQQNWVERMNA